MSGPKFPAGQSVETVDLPAWAIMWLLFSAVSVLFEAAFIFGRQYGTLPKGKFGWLFGALHIYSKVDPTYLDVSHDEVVAMEALNVLEALVIFAALLVPQMQHVTTMMMLTIVNIGQCWKTLWYQLSMLRRFSRVGVPAKASKWCLYLVFGLLNTMYIIMPFLVAMVLFMVCKHWVKHAWWRCSRAWKVLQRQAEVLFRDPPGRFLDLVADQQPDLKFGRNLI